MYRLLHILSFLLVFGHFQSFHAQIIEMETEKTIIDGDTLVDHTTVEKIKVDLSLAVMTYNLYKDDQLIYAKTDSISSISFVDGTTSFVADKNAYELSLFDCSCKLTTASTIVRIATCQVDFTAMRN